MENQSTDKFELEPAIDALAELLHSSNAMMEQLTLTYFDRLRYLNALLFDVAADVPTLRDIWADMSDEEEVAEKVVDSVAAYAVPPGAASKRSRRSGAAMH